MAHDPVPSDGPASGGSPRSVGVVLGAGGVAGWAWLVGTLAGLEEAAGWDARQADLIVGTSAGAGVAAVLRGGRSAVDQLTRYEEDGHARREPPGPDGRPQPATAATATPSATAAEDAPAEPPLTRRLAGGPDPNHDPDPADVQPEAADRAPDAAPPDGETNGGRLRRVLPRAPQLALLAFTRWPPRPGLALAGLLPEGRHSLDDLGDRLAALHGTTWPSDPLWITAIRADTGRRVVFGRDPGRPIDVPTAVRASAAVPGWYEPVRVDGHDHLDGGSWSTTNADLVAGLGFDVVLILAPQSVASAGAGHGKDRVRRAYHRSVLSREVDIVHRNGTDAVVLEPHPDDLDLLNGGPDALDGPRRLSIAQRARQRVVERLAVDPSLAAAVTLPSAPPAAGGMR